MRTASRLNAHYALRRQSLCPSQKELIFLRVNIVGDHKNVVDVTEPLAERFNKGRLARANRTANPDTQRSSVAGAQKMSLRVWATIIDHERNNLVYWVSCAIDARSTMKAAEPRSSIVASSASALAANTASSSLARASCPSVWPSGISRTPAVTKLAT